MASYIHVTKYDDLAGIARRIEAAPVIGLDIETTALRPFDGEIRLMQFAVGDDVFVVDLFQTGKPEPLIEALKSQKTIKCVQNAKFEQKWLLHKFGVELWPIFDTFRASYLIYNGQMKLGHDLYAIRERELQVPPGEDMSETKWDGELSEKQLFYAAEDARFLPPLRTVLRSKMEKMGLFPVALIEFEAVLPEAEIELNGFYLNPEKWKALSEETRKEMEDLRPKILKKMPHPDGQVGLLGGSEFNLNSTKQVMKSLKAMKIDVPNTKETTLAQVAGKHPILRTFLQYRGLAHNLSAFGPDYLRHIHPQTGRVHTDFFPFTGAGRYSSRNPNLQQIPRDKAYRKCWEADCRDRLRRLVIADYSGIEMRIMAELSGDARLTRVFAEGKDPHRVTAAIVCDVPEEEVTKEQRQMAKPVNFGLIYGMQPPKLKLYAAVNYGVFLSDRQAKQFHVRYFEAYNGVKLWQDRALSEGKRTGISKTLSGRIRYLDPFLSYNEFFNTPDQGTGADGLKASLAIVRRALKKQLPSARMVHMVHDEIVVEVDDDPEQIEAAKDIVSKGMVEGMKKFLKKTPIEVEPSAGSSWADK